MKLFIGALGILVILSGAAFIFMYTGWYDVAATTPHWDMTTWFLAETPDRSLPIAKEFKAPLKYPKWLSGGFNEYHAMCRLSTGAPGSPPRLLKAEPNRQSRFGGGSEAKGSELYGLLKTDQTPACRALVHSQ
jgi:hypothetical protein